jgi:hypothetical protein
MAANENVKNFFFHFKKSSANKQIVPFTKSVLETLKMNLGCKLSKKRNRENNKKNKVKTRWPFYSSKTTN